MPPSFALQLELQPIYISSQTPDVLIIKTWISTTLDYMNPIQACIYPATGVTVRIVDENEIQDLNNLYRKKNKPTNVLSFPDALPSFIKKSLDEYPLGDIILCAPIVEKEAADQNKPVIDHWAHMIVHSTLHLLGYDHEIEKEATQMESYEQSILKLLGFPNPYTSEKT